MSLILNLYEDSLAVRNYRPSSLRKNVRLASLFVNWYPTRLNGLRPADVEDYLIYLREIGKSPKTIKNHRSAIKVFCDFLALRGILRDNPVLQVPSMELPEEVPVFLSDDEIPVLMKIAVEEDMVCPNRLPQSHLGSGLR